MSHSKDHILMTPTRTRLRRYSLADTRCFPPTKSATPPYNAHIRTKIDSKSPGYSARVVQYDLEQEKSSPSNQCKYDRLGIFPIVHFFKKDLPFLKRKTAGVNVQINASELSKYNTPEHNRLLLERIIKSSPSNENIPSHKNEANTKSVLEALREISSKRIHSNEEEFVLKEDGKRIHTDPDTETSSRKRMKQNTSQVEDFVAASSSNRLCSIDELMASHSSMDEYIIDQPKKEKTNGTPDSKGYPDSPLKSLEMKYIDVETQTPIQQIVDIPEAVPDFHKVEKENLRSTNATHKIKTKKTSPIKIFDETPLEAMRRNRLTALMGSLTPSKVQNEEVDNTRKHDDKPVLEKPLVSILSGSTKSPHKSNKHVTFEIPETTSSTVAVSFDNFMIPTEVSKPSNGAYVITKTSTAIATPIVSASIVESVPSSKTLISEMPPSVILTSSSSSNESKLDKVVKLSADAVLPFNSVPLSSSTLFDANKNASPVSENSNLNGKLTFTVKDLVTESKGTDQNNIKVNDGVALQNNLFFKRDVPASVIDHSNQEPGFKFKLKESHANVPTTSVNFSFNRSLTVSSTADQPLSATTFDDRSRKTIVNTTLYASSANTPTFLQVPSSSLSNMKENSQIFGTGSTTGILNNGTTVLNNSTNNNFSKSTVSTFSADRNQIISTTSANIPSNFIGVSASSTNIFTQSIPTFDTNSTNFSAKTSNANFIPASKLFNFGPNNSVGTSFPPTTFTSGSHGLFDHNSKATFVNTTTAPPIFPSMTNTLSKTPTVSVASFGNTVPSTFNKPTTNSIASLPPVFPGTAVSKAPMNIPSFGLPTTSFNTTAPVFNASSVSSFGNDAATKSVFGQTTPLFGSVITSNFANGNNNNTTIATNAFGNVETSTNNIFGNTGSFGTTTTTSSSFNTNKVTNFGTSNFGTSQNSGFNIGQNNEFKNNSTHSFGTPSSSSFGGNTNTTGLTGFGKTSTDFASNANFIQPNNSAFSSTFRTVPSFDKSAGSTNLEVTPFGGANTIGTSNFPTNPQISQSDIFTFGTNNNSKPGVFSFGSSEPPKPSFNFTADNNSNVFGVGNAGFGSNPSGFNSTSTPQFNMQSAGPGMFNIGTGGASTPMRSRTQHKAKRRT